MIRRDVIMGHEVIAYTTNHITDSLEISIKYQDDTEENTVNIMDGCWICSRVIILPRINIEKCEIVAASSVATKDIENYTVVGGNSVRVIKNRRETKNGIKGN